MRELHTFTDLIACLQENPTRRLVKYIDVVDPDDTRAVVEYSMDDELGLSAIGKLIATIAESSNADAELDAVSASEGCGSDPSQRAPGPIRYGPGCSEWSLSEFQDLRDPDILSIAAEAAYEKTP